jgi:hypothetical protein
VVVVVTFLVTLCLRRFGISVAWHSRVIDMVGFVFERHRGLITSMIDNTGQVSFRGLYRQGNIETH